MGDAPSWVEKKIIKDYNSIPCDILKVGHHGSDTSSCEEFITYMNPKTPFQYAVKKYGVKAFIRTTLAVFNTEEEAYELENKIVNETVEVPNTASVKNIVIIILGIIFVSLVIIIVLKIKKVD